MFQKLENILRCPESGQRLILDEAGTHYRVENSATTYPVVNGIVDFLPNRSDKVSRAYDRFASLYEKIITNSNGLFSLFNWFVWGPSYHHLYCRVIPDYIPRDFDGILLDVPVGTGVFAAEKYRQLERATIIVVDYSREMLDKTRKRFEQSNINNAIFLHADVAWLPLADQAIDLVFSMNGIHAFADKDGALREIARVLKPEGQFSGCFYIKGQRRLTDMVIGHIYYRVGTFSKPFYSQGEARDRLSADFRIVESQPVRSMFVFNARKISPREAAP